MNNEFITLEIVEREAITDVFTSNEELSSCYWIELGGVAWGEPFVHLSQAIRQLNKILEFGEYDLVGEETLKQ
jgi:hypothetical protein